MQTNETPNGQQEKKPRTKATVVDKPPEPPPEPVSARPDPTKPIPIHLVRCADLTLNQDNGSKALAVGHYVANSANINGVVHEMWRYPDGTVLVVILNQYRAGPDVVSAEKYMIVQGTLECEVLG